MSEETKRIPVNQQNPPKFTTEDRNAMRAYLARCEVRLSTIHRVAVGFLSGAGLLFLLPVFLKDGVLSVIRSILDYSPTFASGSGIGHTIATLVIYICLFYPFILSLSLPAVALLLLLKDIVRFYFVGHPPGFPNELFNPRFILTGIAFSPDESEEVKARVLRYQYGTDMINFVISHADAQSSYYHDVIDKPDRMIVPNTRNLPKLIKMGVVEIPSGKPLDELEDTDVVRVHGTYSNGDEEETLLQTPYVDRTLKEIDGFNAALGLAGFIERSLYEEVAKTEVSLVRHALKLRRLVLRYIQALLILIWTSVITFLMLPFLQDGKGRFSLLVIFAIAYFIWAILAPYIVQLPLYWLVSSSKKEVRRKGVSSFQKSDAIQKFGRLTQKLCYAALLTSVIALLLEIILHLT
ncbi:MAG: hypothetical protein H0X30_18670 [Anaerolineae bacterium]|nr:hypothetical protein [Anaerolineae bacterium]